jgi:hypothetical protein
LGCLKEIAPGDSKTYNVAFKPLDERDLQEEIRFYDTNAVVVTLKGKGFVPEVAIEGDLEFMDLGNLLVGEETGKTFKLTNPTLFPFDFELQCATLGTSNKNGKKAFYFSPWQGRLEAGETKAVKVVFQPSEVSDDYTELLRIQINGKSSKKSLLLKGCGFQRQAFAKRVFEFIPDLLEEAHKLAERLEITGKRDWLSTTTAAPFFGHQTFLLKIDRSKNDPAKKAVQKVAIGCCKSSRPNSDKPIEFEFVPTFTEFLDCFRIGNQKGKVSPGQTIEMTFELIPPTEETPAKKDLKVKAGDKPVSSSFSDYLPLDIRRIGRWMKLEGTLRLTGGFSSTESDSVSYLLVVEGYADRI